MNLIPFSGRSAVSINMTTTIQAQVSPRILQKAHLLFNQNPKTILHELLQNCRRADAKRVDISVSSTATGCEITIHDDGTGIADPSSLLNLGGSGWDESISNSESPAGMGFFSLSHLPGGVHVESGCWTVELNSDAFKGVAPCPVHSSCYIEGTKISFSLDLKFDVFIGVVSACVLYYPVSVFVNGNPAVQVDFPKESLFVHKAKGSSIALRENRSFWGPDLNLNFFGLTLKVELKPYWPFHFFVNVNDNEIVDLVLPSRDKVVENQKFEALKIECRRATYEYIFQLSIPHSLPYCYYQEAHRMGIMIPEAQAQLRRVKASNIWDSDSDWVGPDSGNLPIPAGELQVSANSIIFSKLLSSQMGF